MLEFRLVECFNRNYNTIDRGMGCRAAIALNPVFTGLACSAEVRRERPSKHHVMIAFRVLDTS